MPKMLNDGAVEYEDGTPATEAQVGSPCHFTGAGCVQFHSCGYTNLSLYYAVDGERCGVVFDLGC